MASGTWIRQNSCQVPAPSMRAASDSSSGMFTKWARIQNTANGMNSPMSGRMIAHRVFSSPMVADLVVERHDDALERQRQAEHEREEDQPAAGHPQVSEREAGHACR